MNLRTSVLLVGILAFGAAAIVLAEAAVIDLSRWVIIAIAVGYLIVALSVVSRRRGVRTRGSTPDPERRNHVPAPGTDLIDAVSQFYSDYENTFVPTTRIRTGLGEAVLSVLTRFRGLTPSEAQTQLEEGTWTDDPYAAAFVSEDIEPPTRSLRGRLSERISGHDSFDDGVRRTVTAIAAIADSVGTGPETEAGSDGASGPNTTDSPSLTIRSDETDTNRPVPRTTRATVDGTSERDYRETAHWAGIGVVALVAIGLGAVTESAAVVMAGALGIGYAGFARTLSAPTPELSIERTVSDESPEPDDDIYLEVTITNKSDRFLPDLRFVDGVPSGLPVTDGVARLGTALRPGESVTLEYTISARRGRHVFDPALAITRDLSRSAERECLIASETTIVCEPVLRPVTSNVPLRTTASTFSGRLTTADSGSGTQFHSVREYRRSDPLNRIDWNRHARTGELATLEFHEERAARVLVLVDARKANYLAPGPDVAHAVDRSVDAAGRIAASLLADGDTVGLAALGPTDGRDRGADEESVDPCWLAPGSGHHHRIRFQQLLATHPQFSTLPPATPRRWSIQLQRIHRQLSSETQVVLLTPLCDRTSSHVARWLDARGHAVTVVSPDPTADGTPSQTLVRVARRIRQFDLQRAGIPVVDWPADETIDEAFLRVSTGRGRGGSGGRSGGEGGGGSSGTQRNEPTTDGAASAGIGGDDD